MFSYRIYFKKSKNLKTKNCVFNKKIKCSEFFFLSVQQQKYKIKIRVAIVKTFAEQKSRQV